MNTIPAIELSGPIPLESTNDTKRAAIFFTIGTPLKAVAAEKYRDPQTGKVRKRAHIVFATDQAGLTQLHQVYDVADADTRLDEFLKQSQSLPELKAFVTELQNYLTPALIVWGRRFLENKQRLVEFIQSEANEFSVIGGEPVFNEKGHHVGLQAFTLIFHKNK